MIQVFNVSVLNISREATEDRYFFDSSSSSSAGPCTASLPRGITVSPVRAVSYASGVKEYFWRLRVPTRMHLYLAGAELMPSLRLTDHKKFHPSFMMHSALKLNLVEQGTKTGPLITMMLKKSY